MGLVLKETRRVAQWRGEEKVKVKRERGKGVCGVAIIKKTRADGQLSGMAE